MVHHIAKDYAPESGPESDPVSDPAASAEELSTDLLSGLLRKQVLVSVGSGGVGKTTVAAALGLKAAHQGGVSTLVMTIDPARRLATSLGLSHLGHEPQLVMDNPSSSDSTTRAALHAMMLDPKQTFDDMVRRYAPDRRSATRLLQSKLYRQIAARLAGAQEYAAIEKLHEIHQSGRFQLLVLDTPPTANALDFFDAPHKLVDAVDSPVVDLLVSTYRKAGRVSLGMLGFGAAYVLRRLARFTGTGVLDEIAGFLVDLSGLLGGMRQRASQVMELLASDAVGFIVVTSPDPSAVDEAIGFCERLAETSVQPLVIVVNRVHRLHQNGVPDKRILVELFQDQGALEAGVASRLADALLACDYDTQSLARADAAQITRLRAVCGQDIPCIQIPRFGQDVHDIDGLKRLGAFVR